MAAVTGSLFAVKRSGRGDRRRLEPRQQLRPHGRAGRRGAIDRQPHGVRGLADGRADRRVVRPALGGEVRLIASRTVFAAWPMAVPIAA
jgi:hypothetical protein